MNRINLGQFQEGGINWKKFSLNLPLVLFHPSRVKNSVKIITVYEKTIIITEFFFVNYITCTFQVT